MQPVEKSIELPNHVVLPYFEQGGPLGPPLLLLHGLADSWHAFEPVLAPLPETVHAIALTQRGHGNASRPATGYGTRDFSDDLAAFMDAIHLGAAIIVAGSSGGFVARRFALDHPERTLGLGLLGSPALLRDKPRLLEVWENEISKLTDPIDPDWVRQFAVGTITNPVPPWFLDVLIQENLKVPAFVWSATTQGLLEDDSFEELNAIKTPTLIIWGDQDAILPRSDQERLALAIPGARMIVYPGAGHAIYMEEPERVAADLVSFIESVAAG